MPRHLTSTSRPLALAFSLALIGAGLALGAANATAAPGVTPDGATSVTQDVPLCAPAPVTPVDGVAPAPQPPQIVSAQFDAPEYPSSAPATLRIVTNVPFTPFGCAFSDPIRIGPSTPAGLIDTTGSDTLSAIPDSGVGGTVFTITLTAHPTVRTTYAVPITFDPGTGDPVTVTVTVTFAGISDAPCAALPMPVPVWTMTTSPSGPLALGQSYTVTIDSGVDYSACPSVAPTVTFSVNSPLFFPMPNPPQFSPDSCQVVGHSCSVTLRSDAAGAFQVHAVANGQEIYGHQEVSWSDNSTPVNWFTQFQAFFQQIFNLLRRLLSVFGLFAVA